ncbi:MAG: penicillin acylase family protein [Paracoccaceae bacterium]|nr:penicillin acylase family protein [Paracoccaceae bacterium]
MRVFRLLLKLSTSLAILAGLTVVFVYYLASRSLPDYDKTIDVQGILGDVRIVRDTANVPHIFGSSDGDVFFGLGYVHAQDRLWQMLTVRRTVQGRMSEVFGERTLYIDKLLRTLDLYGAATTSVAAQSPEALVALQAYSAGVNARIDEINESALGRGAPEMFLFKQDVPPWTPADSLAVIKVMALQLSGHLEYEVLRARTSLVLEPERVADILPDVPGNGLTALPDFAALVPGLPTYAEAEDMPFDAFSPFKKRAFAGASNAFAASPLRAAAGGTLLANDPHLGFAAPSSWYLARLELQTGGVIGGTLPGLPAVLTGRTAKTGWGITSAYVDDQDVYIERLNPDNQNEYQTRSGFAPFKTQSTIIQVKDAEPVTLAIRKTNNGPVLPGEHYALGTITPPGHVTSLAWTAFEPADTSYTAAYDLMNAANVDEILEAGEQFHAPAQNLMAVDLEHIAFKTIGAMPRRSAQHQSQGRLPTPGWRRENQWNGTSPYAANPEFYDPQSGILGNTNNKTVHRPFPLHVSFEWGDTQRIQRWKSLMEGRPIHTRESFIEAQQDSVSVAARTLLPLIGADLWFTGNAAADGSPERLRQRALELLANWNGEMNEHLPEPLIYSAWTRALQDRLIRDDLGPLATEYTHVEPLFIERVFRDVDGASVWCDVVQSADIETCSEISQQALDDALVWITDRYGSALESLRWGDLHQATHDHPVLGKVPVLQYFVNIRQSTSGGDHTLNRGVALGEGENPYQNHHGAGFRGVYDFADPDSSVFIIATGQSGHPLSRHYDDLGELWRRGEYVPMTLDPELAGAAATGVTVLQPR